MGNPANARTTKIRQISVVEFIEVYSYSALLLIFGYIIAMAVIGMAYGSGTKKEQEKTNSDMFFIEYMISIILVPVGVTLLHLAVKNKL